MPKRRKEKGKGEKIKKKLANQTSLWSPVKNSNANCGRLGARGEIPTRGYSETALGKEVCTLSLNTSDVGRGSLTFIELQVTIEPSYLIMCATVST